MWIECELIFSKSVIFGKNTEIFPRIALIVKNLSQLAFLLDFHPFLWYNDFSDSGKPDQV